MKGQTLREIQMQSRKPLFVFIEGTKTNGMGVLELSPDIHDQLLLAKPLHIARIDYTFKYFSPYNTTET